VFIEFGPKVFSIPFMSCIAPGEGLAAGMGISIFCGDAPGVAAGMGMLISMLGFGEACGFGDAAAGICMPGMFICMDGD
jgi:hypothetical protein